MTLRSEEAYFSASRGPSHVLISSIELSRSLVVCVVSMAPNLRIPAKIRACLTVAHSSCKCYGAWQKEPRYLLSRRDCIESLRSSYTGLYPQRGGRAKRDSIWKALPGWFEEWQRRGGAPASRVSERGARDRIIPWVGIPIPAPSFFGVPHHPAGSDEYPVQGYFAHKKELLPSRVTIPTVDSQGGSVFDERSTTVAPYGLPEAGPSRNWCTHPTVCE